MILQRLSETGAAFVLPRLFFPVAAFSLFEHDHDRVYQRLEIEYNHHHEQNRERNEIYGFIGDKYGYHSHNKQQYAVCAEFRQFQVHKDYFPAVISAHNENNKI